MQLNFTNLDMGLGQQAPQLTKARLEIQTTQLSWPITPAILQQFCGMHAWVMYTDATAFQPKQVDLQKRILQAEVYLPTQNQSLQLRHHQGDTYQLLTISQQPEDDATFFYVDQTLLLANDQVSNQQAYYRCWYKLDTAGDRAYRWQPYLTQFRGYNTQGGAL
jgi:hypothetical protein